MCHTDIESETEPRVLRLVLAVGQPKKLVANARVVRYLSQPCPEILGEVQRMVEAPDLEVTPARSGGQA